MFHALLKIGVSLGLLAALLYWLDWGQALSLLRTVAPLELALALALLTGAYLANGLRLAGLQKRIGLHIRGPLFWGSYYAGLMFNNVLPAGVGGDAIRILALARRGFDFTSMLVTALVDRFLGLLALFAVGGVALLASPGTLPLGVAPGRVLGVVSLLLFTGGLLWLPRLGLLMLRFLAGRSAATWATRLETGTQHLERLFAGPLIVIRSTFLSLSSHALFILAFAACGHSLLPGMGLASYFIAIPGVMLVLMVPISFGGLGLREASTVGLLVWMGADAQAALTLSLVFLALSWVAVLPGVASAVHYGLNPHSSEADAHGS